MAWPHTWVEPRRGPVSVGGLLGPDPASAVPPHPFLSLPAGWTPRPRGVSVNDHQALSAWPSAPQQAVCSWRGWVRRSPSYILLGCALGLGLTCSVGISGALRPSLSFLGAVCCAKHQGPEWSSSERLQHPALSSSPPNTAS